MPVCVVCSLSPRLRELFFQLLTKYSCREIGKRMNIKEGTVKVYCKRLFPDMGVNSRIELMGNYIAGKYKGLL